MHLVRYFLTLCETLNFSRAAETCNVSQPDLTRAVRKLEEEPGGLLLRREHLLTHLTDFGRLVRPHLEQMMAEAEAAKSTAPHFLPIDNAPINLGVMRTVRINTPRANLRAYICNAGNAPGYQLRSAPVSSDHFDSRTETGVHSSGGG
jgi:DNA-binding transcriptional LysR family regulator